MPALVAATAGVFVTAWLAAASLRLPSITSFGLALYVLAVSEVVAITEILSSAHWAGAAGYAGAQTIAFGAAAGAWRWRRRPSRPRFPLDLGALPRQPVVLLLGSVVVGALLYQAFLVAATPPNNWDSMTYHLARAAEWYHRQAVEYYPAHTARENAFQPNAEMTILYTFAFVGRDTVAAAPQLLAELASIVGVYGVARRLGFDRSPAAFAGLLTATLAEVALQSVTTQNDLFAASFLVCGLYFLLGRSRPELALAGLCVGLAVGTKATAVFGLPLLALAAVIRLDRRRLAEAAAWAVAGIAVVGAYGYALNLSNTGRLLGDPSATEPLRPELTAAGTVSTVARLTFRLVDVSGFTGTASWIRADQGWAGRSADWLFDALHIVPNPPEASGVNEFLFQVNGRANEDFSYFGPLGFLLLPPLTIAVLVAVVRRRVDLVQIVPVLAIPVYVLAVALSNRYNAFLGRFMLAGVLLAMPLAAWVYNRSRWLAGGVALLAAVALTLAHARNMGKPTGLDGTTPVWSLTRTQAQTISNSGMAPVIDEAERLIPADANVGYVLEPEDWLYPLYGPGLDRTVVRLPRDGLFEAAEAAGATWIVMTGPYPPPEPGWRLAAEPGQGFTFFARRA